MTRKKCYAWAKKKGLKNRGNYGNRNEPWGCFVWRPNNKVYFNPVGRKKRRCDNNFRCVKKKC